MRISDWSSDVCSSDLLRQRAIGAAAVLHQLALADHRHEALGQRLLLRELAELERADQLIERQRSFMRGERIEDQIAARNRIRVAALLLRIFSIGSLPIGGSGTGLASRMGAIF